jgi:hypothetical protein
MTSAAILKFLSHYSVAVAQSWEKFVEFSFFFAKNIRSLLVCLESEKEELGYFIFAGKWQVGGYFATCRHDK